MYTPQILAVCVSEDKCISLAGCGAQFLLSCAVTYTKCYFLSAMAYNHHVTIYNPLLYSSMMSRSLCTGLTAGSYVGGFLNVIAYPTKNLCLSFCGKNIIDHFFDAPPLVKISFAETHVYENVRLGVMGFTVHHSILTILISYFNTLLEILRL